MMADGSPGANRVHARGRAREGGAMSRRRIWDDVTWMVSQYLWLTPGRRQVFWR